MCIYYVHKYVHVCMYICTCMCVLICMYVCMCGCVCTGVFGMCVHVDCREYVAYSKTEELRTQWIEAIQGAKNVVCPRDAKKGMCVRVCVCICVHMNW